MTAPVVTEAERIAAGRRLVKHRVAVPTMTDRPALRLGGRDRDAGVRGQRFDAFLTNFARSFDCCTRVGSWTYIMWPAG